MEKFTYTQSFSRLSILKKIGDAPCDLPCWYKPGMRQVILSWFRLVQITQRRAFNGRQSADISRLSEISDAMLSGMNRNSSTIIEEAESILVPSDRRSEGRPEAADSCQNCSAEILLKISPSNQSKRTFSTAIGLNR